MIRWQTLFLLLFLATACAPGDMVSLKGTSSILKNGASSNDTLSDPLTDNATEITPEMLAKTSYRWDHKSQAAEWTMLTSQAIDEFGLLNLPVPKDIEEFCPRYRSLSSIDRRMFWIYFLSSMVELESSFNTNSTYQEAFKDLAGKFIISRGLLQMSIESVQGYGCPIQSAQELHDPATNLNCGVRLISYFVKKDGLINSYSGGRWLGVARYWAVLRTKLAPQIVDWTNALPLCQ